LEEGRDEEGKKGGRRVMNICTGVERERGERIKKERS